MTPMEKLAACRVRLIARGLDADAIIRQATENLRYWREHPAVWDEVATIETLAAITQHDVPDEKCRSCYHADAACPKCVRCREHCLCSRIDVDSPEFRRLQRRGWVP